MCELFGLSGNRAIAPSDLLREFGRRGGATADNPDGWGLACHTSEGFVLYKAAEAAASSPRFAALAGSVRVDLMIAHVRKANPPTAHVPANTHPFERECCGRQWVFAHNGKVPELMRADGCCHPQASMPIGETDSEYAFCFLLDEIARVFAPAAENESMPWLRMLAARSGTIAEHGQFNFLMSDGERLIAYGHDRLYYLQHSDGDARLALIASAPLSADARWQAFSPRELQVYRAGTLRGRIQIGAGHDSESKVTRLGSI